MKIKTIGLHTTEITGAYGWDYIQYFYTWERRDRNGNSVYRVYIIDPDNAVHITLYHGYESFIDEYVQQLIESKREEVN